MRGMSMFVVVALEPAKVDAVQRAVQEKFPSDNLAVSTNAWVISATGIAKDVSDRLIGSPPPPGSPQLVIFSISGYFGFAPNTYWEWIALKLAANVNVR